MLKKMNQKVNKRFAILLLFSITFLGLAIGVIGMRKDAQAFNGAGTDVDPYVISTKADLKLLQSNVGKGINYIGNYFVLGKDIDMEGEAFLSIGNTIVNSFGGFFDGRNFTIKNLAVMKSEVDQAGSYNGLFGYLYGATIENLNVENIRLNVSAKSGDDGAAGGANLDGKDGNSAVTELYTGGIAGYAVYSTIKNSYVDGSITVLGGNGGNGGLAGTRNTNGNGTNGGNGGDAKDIFVGGIVGKAVDTNIVASGFSGSIIGVGGFAGSGGNGGAYRSTTFTTGGNGGNAGAAGAVYLGGIAGQIIADEYGALISKNYSSSELYARAGQGGNGGTAGNGRTIGGAGGANSVAGAVYSGGIVGHTNSSIEHSFTEGSMELQAAPKGVYGLTAAGTTPGPNGENASQVQEFIFGGIAGVMVGNNTHIKSSYTLMEATEKHDYGYFNDVHIRLAGLVGLIDADSVSIVDNIVLTKTLKAETEASDKGEMLRTIASYATYKTQEQMEGSILVSLGNKNIDMFLYTPNQGNQSEYMYTDGDENSSKATQIQLINNKDIVFENLDWENWQINSNVNDGYPTMIGATIKRFNYNKVVSINTYQDLKTLANRNNSGYSYYGQTIFINSDITMDSSVAWEPIGKDFRTAFQGKIVGQNKKVQTLYITKATDYKGLFGYASKIQIKDLTIVDPNFTSNSGSYVGGFVGYSLFDAKLENLKVVQTGSTSGNNAVIKGNRIIGGIAGQLDGLNNNVMYVSNTTNIVATNTPFVSNSTYAGGLFGLLKRTNMDRSYNVGNVTINASTTPQYYAGGLVGGISSGQSVISNSFNVGNVTGGANIAGLVGTIDIYGHDTLLDRVYASGELNATYSASAITSYTSPLVGQANFNVTISNSVNALNKLTISTKQSPRYVGKLIAFVAPSKIVTTTLTYTRDSFKNINNYYNSNAVNTAVAGTNSAYYYDVTAQSTAKTFAQITTKDFFENSARFDMSDIWDIDPEINNGLPYLRDLDGNSDFASQPGYGNNPILIKTAQDLATFRDEVNSGKKFIGQVVALDNHINLNGVNWTPIGINATNYFGGTFNGNNFTISGLMVDKATAFSGLFGYAINAVFKNIHISQPAIVQKAGDDKGALLGRGTTNIIIDNVHVTGGYVKSTANNVGGIVGYFAAGARVSNSSTTNIEIKGANYVGGIVGYAIGNANNTSINISDSFTASHVYSTASYSAGIAGYIRGGTIERVYTTGSIVSMNGYSGGIYAYSSGNQVAVRNAMVGGNVYSSRLGSTAIAGGVAGQVAVASTFANVLVTGNVRAASSYSSTGNYSSTAGGVVGYGNIAGITINNSAVMSNQVLAVGELIKWNGAHPIGAGRETSRPSGGGVIGSETNIYLNTMETTPIKGLTSAQLSTVVSAAKPESAFYDIGSYYSIGWGTTVIAENNSAIWNIDSQVNNGLPYLTKLGEPIWPKGSIKDPYLISNKNDLVKLANDVSGGNTFSGQYFELVESFEIGDWMTPIGINFANSFGGIFNGNFNTLSNLKNPGNRAGIFGLFGALTQAEVHNLILHNVNITLTTATSGGDRVGALAGQAYANTRISNIAVTSGSITSPALYIGGLVGLAHSLDVTKSYTSITVKGGAKVGGIIGAHYAGTITKSYSNGNVFGTLGSNYASGGIVGYVVGNVTIEDVYSTGNVSDNSTSTYAIAGGIVGHISSKVAVLNRVYATGDITAHTTWTSTTSGYGAYAGGLVGVSNLASSSTGVKITNSISYSKKIVASVVKAHTAQSVPGAGSTTTTLTSIATGSNSWYFEDVEKGTPKGVAGAASANTYMAPKPLDFMLNQANLSNTVANGGLGWDFDNTWNIKESVNRGYPYLSGLIPNRSDLKILLEKASQYVRSEWLDTTFNVFEQKQQNAVSVYENNQATFEQLDTAYIELSDAIDGLRGDTRELQAIYDKFHADNTVMEVDENGVEKEVLLSYLFKNFGIVESALASAKIILDENSNAYNNSFINNSKSVLAAAVAGLIIDKTELQKLINDVNELKQENYDVVVWIEVERARSYALKVNNNDGMVAGTKDVYQAINGIKQAMGDLVLDIGYLQTLIAEAESYIEGISPIKFTSATYNAYIKAISDAKLITNESSVEALNQAIFNLSVELTNLTVNKSILQSNIAFADNKNASYYTQSSYSNLVSSLSIAKEFASRPRPKLSDLKLYIAEMDNVNAALETALNNLVLNTQLLYDVIAQGKLEQNDDLIYTQESWQVLQDAIEEAEIVVETMIDTITGEQLVEIVEKVKNAILNLEINKTYLVDLIANAKSIKKGYYDSVSYSNLQAAILLGENLLVDPEITIESLRITMELIRQSIVGLKIDSQIIQNFIDMFENPLNENYIKPADWSADSYEQLSIIITDAKQLLLGEYDNNSLLNMINRIENAISNLVPDKRDLDLLINELSSWVNTKYRQDKDGNFILDENGNLKQFLVYSAGTWRNLQDAIGLAKITQHSNSTTKAQIEQEIANLNFAVDSLRVDVTELEYRISHAEDLLLETLKYTADSLELLRISKESAQTALLNDRLTLEQLQNVLDDLVSKINNLVVDRSSIIQLIENANALIKENYTENTWIPFEYTRNYVNSIIYAPGLTPEDVINFYNNLEVAMDALRPKKDALVSLVLYASALGDIYMQPESYINLQEEIVFATGVINNTQARLADVQLAQNQLQTAIDNIVVDKAELGRLIEFAKTKYTLNYTTESITTLKDIVADSTLILGDNEATIDEVINGSNAIIDGIDGLTVNTSEIEILIEAIETALVVEYNEIAASEYYIFETYQHLLDRLYDAKRIDESIKLDYYNVVLQNLKDARDGLIVDKASLVALIQMADKVNTNLYTANSVSLFNAKLSTAKTTVANNGATITQYLTSLNELQTAFNNLVFDSSAIEKLRTQAEAILENEKDYTSGSIADLLLAYNRSEDYALEEYVDICVELEAKINSVVSIKTLKEKMAAASNLIEQNIQDYETQALKYYEIHFERLLSGYERAQELVENIYLSQQEVDYLVEELSHESYLVYIGNLKEVYAQAMLEDEDLYSRTSFARLKDAIEAARLVLEDADSLKERVDEVAGQVQQALEGLEALMFTNQLEELYNDVKHYQAEDYTASSFRVFALYMLQAQAIIENPEASQTAALEVLNMLQDAIEKLVEIKEFKDLINTYSDIKPLGYTLNSYQDFVAELNQAKETIKNENLTTQQVQTAIASLQNAKSGLTVDKNQLQALYNRVRFYQQSEFTENSNFVNFTSQLANAQTALQSGITGDILNATISLNDAVLSLKVKDDELIAMFELAKNIKASDYLFGFEEFVSKATQTEADYTALEHVSLEQYKQYFEELNSLRNKLVYNNTLLLSLIAQANQILENQSDYSIRSIDALRIQVIFAQSFVPEIDDYELMCNALEVSIENVVYLKGLRDAVGLAKQFESENLEDYFNNELTYLERGFSNLRNSIIEADSALKDSNITNQKVAELTQKLDIEANLISILPLRAAIERAQAVDKTKYSEQSYQEVLNALTFANNVTGNYNSTLDNVNEAVQRIDQAIQGLKPNVDEGQQLVEWFNSLNPLHYESGYEELETQIDSLSQIMDDLLANQDVNIEAYLQALNQAKAKQNLLVHNSKQSLSSLVDEFNSKEYLYTAESFAEFKVYLTQAKQKIDNNVPMLKEEIQAEIDLINLKANQLVLKEVDTEEKDIKVIETNTTFKFYDKDKNIIDKTSYVYNPENPVYLTNIAQGEKVSTIFSQFENSNLKVFDKNGNEISNLTNLRAATGQQVKLFDNQGNILDVVTIIVKGDVNGDGLVNVFDIINVANLIVNVDKETMLALAADVTSDERINVFDIVLLAQAVLGTDIYQDIRLGDKV